MKRIYFFITFIITILLGTATAYGYNPQTIANAIANFSKEIKVNSSDVSQVLTDAFNYDPRIAMYYQGYSGSYNSHSSTINIIYTNTDIPIEDIYVAESEEDFTNLITRAMLYSENNLYVVSKVLPYSSDALNSYISNIEDSCPIAYMGYQSSNISTLETEIGNYSSYSIAINYSIDTATLNQMKRDLEQKACSIVASNIAADMPPYMKVYIIHNYIVNNCKYATDHDTNPNPVYYTAYGTLVNGVSVCDGYATSAQILFDLCGIENIKISGNSKGEGHAWNLVKLDDAYYHIDTTWDDPVSSDGLDYLKYNYYNLSDNEISKDHAWQTQDYPSAQGSYYTYTKTVELMQADKNSYTQGYNSFESIFSKYPQLTGSNSKNNNTLEENENISPIEPNDILENADKNRQPTYITIIEYIIAKINENQMLCLEICGFLVLLLILKNIFSRKE